MELERQPARRLQAQSRRSRSLGMVKRDLGPESEMPPLGALLLSNTGTDSAYHRQTPVVIGIALGAHLAQLDSKLGRIGDGIACQLGQTLPDHLLDGRCPLIDQQHLADRGAMQSGAITDLKVYCHELRACDWRCWPSWRSALRAARCHLIGISVNDSIAGNASANSLRRWAPAAGYAVSNHMR